MKKETMMIVIIIMMMIIMRVRGYGESGSDGHPTWQERGNHVFVNAVRLCMFFIIDYYSFFFFVIVNFVYLFILMNKREYKMVKCLLIIFLLLQPHRNTRPCIHFPFIPFIPLHSFFHSFFNIHGRVLDECDAYPAGRQLSRSAPCLPQSQFN